MNEDKCVWCGKEIEDNREIKYIRPPKYIEFEGVKIHPSCLKELILETIKLIKSKRDEKSDSKKEELEVIGNIYENPELLESDENA